MKSIETRNEKADELAKAATEGGSPADAATDAVPDDYRWETSLSHMTRVATEARTRDCIVDLRLRRSRAKVQTTPG